MLNVQEMSRSQTNISIDDLLRESFAVAIAPLKALTKKEGSFYSSIMLGTQIVIQEMLENLYGAPSIQVVTGGQDNQRLLVVINADLEGSNDNLINITGLHKFMADFENLRPKLDRMNSLPAHLLFPQNRGNNVVISAPIGDLLQHLSKMVHQHEGCPNHKQNISDIINFLQNCHSKFENRNAPQFNN